MQDTDLILTLTACLTAALVCGYITFRLRLSPIVGYLLAGLAVGPTTPGFVADGHLAEQFAEVGVILLMFGVGLQFHVEELLSVRRIAVPGAIVRSVVATALGTEIGLYHGWSGPASLVFGLALSIASTVVLIRILADNDDLQTEAGRVAVGWLVVEDLITVIILVLLPAVFGKGVVGPIGIGLSVVAAVVKLSAMVGLMFVVGERVIPWILARVAATRSRELFTLTVLVVALGVAVVSARFFGVSTALGAFLAGLVVGRSDFSLRAATDALPMRDAFAVLFFVSIGILFHPSELLASPWLIAATLGVILIAKPAATVAVALWSGYPPRTAVPVALSTAHIGEFSFILAAEGKVLGILDDRVTSTLVAASILAITISPMLYRLNGPIERVLRGLLPAPAITVDHVSVNQSVLDKKAGLYRAVVVGYGPVGKTLTRLLIQSKFEPVVIELNHQTVSSLNARGIAAVHGDASHREVLEQAGTARAVALILSSAASRGAAETIRKARELNPAIRVMARTLYLRQDGELRAAGADAVFSGEGEVALSMTESLLQQLGATAEQIDRERDRIRAEFFVKGNMSEPLTTPASDEPADPTGV